MSLFDTEQRGILLWRYRWRSGSKAPAQLYFGAILLFISSVFVGILGNDAYRSHRLASEGQIAIGKVVKKTLHRAGDSGNANTSYEVDYVFLAANGREVADNDTIDPDTWDQIEEGGPVPVQFAASDPRISRIRTGAGETIIGDIALVVASLMWLVGATLAVRGLLGPRSARAGGGPPDRKTVARTARGKNEIDHPSFLKGRVRPWIVFGAILLACGALFLLIGVANLADERAFRDGGRTATAIVLTKSSYEERNQQSNSSQTHYDLEYRFTTVDGKSVNGSAEVNGRTWRSIQERDPIQITYLPERPSRNRLAADHPGIFLWTVSVLGAALLVGGTSLIGYGVFDAMRKHRKRCE
jgi:uncharacterized protein DUF3592